MMTINQIRKEAPEGATHIDQMGRYWNLPKGIVFQNNTWVVDGTGFACIWTPIKPL